MSKGSIFNDLNISYKEGDPRSHSQSDQHLSLGNPGWTLSTGHGKANSAATGVPWYVWVIGGLFMLTVIAPRRSRR